MLLENSKGERVIFVFKKKMKLQGDGGVLCEIASMVGVWIFPGP